MQNKLAEYYHEMSNAEANKGSTPDLGVAEKKKEYSHFFKSIYFLVKRTEKLLEPERPLVNGDLWLERKYQVAILNLSLKRALANPFPDDSSLLIDCHFVKNFSNTTWLPFSKYNEFVEDLREILDKIEPNQIYQGYYKNIQYLQRQLEEMKSENAEHIVRQLKLEYAKQLEGEAQLSKIEAGLQQVSGNEKLSDLASFIKVQVSSELKKVALFYDSKARAIEENQNQMSEIFLNLVEELMLANEIIKKYRTEHPGDYQAAVNNLLHSAANRNQPVRALKSDKEVSQLLSGHRAIGKKQNAQKGVLTDESNNKDDTVLSNIPL